MSVFEQIPVSDYVAENSLAFAVKDRFPVFEGHTLVISRRRVATWFDATRDEQIAILDLIDVVKGLLDAEFGPSGYNVGFNAGSAAGQTIDHLHVHVIPRYEGDLSDPAGGVRLVNPERGNYLRPSKPRLVTPAKGRMRAELARCLVDPDYERIDFLVAFVMASGLRVIEENIETALARGAKVRVLTTDYLAVTDVAALGYLLDRAGPAPSGGGLDVRVFSDPKTSFHPKAYLFRSSGGVGVAFVGSSNLSRSALQVGVEWNLKTGNIDELVGEFDLLWSDPRSTPLTAEWLEKYAIRRKAMGDKRVEHVGELVADEEPAAEIAPWSVQQQALDALAATRLEGYQAGLVVMATGLGKTWLAAFDSTRPGIGRVLFVAHREEILKRSRDVFRMVRPGGSLTLFVGGDQDPSGDVVFASIQSLEKNLARFPPSAFDYVVVDEFHHAAAPTYRRVIDHFTPRFMLGLTATPDRTDAADLLALCDDNLVFECGLIEGLNSGLLCPFSYRAIKDVADYEHIPWRSGRFDALALANQLETQQRADQVYTEWLALSGPGRRTIGFCCSVTHADFMANYFVGRGVRARSVHSEPSSADRITALADLETGDVDVIFSVDLFNEGIDVPALDIVLMLRPTESPIVFFQQLGRGLRRVDGKTKLDVLDLVGNHRGFLMKARILAALSGKTHVTDREAVEILKEQIDALPPGCAIVVDTEVVDLLSTLVGGPSKIDRLTELIRAWMDDHGGQRPTALEIALVAGKSLEVTRKKGGWLGLLGSLGQLTDPEKQVVEIAGEVLAEIEFGAYSKSYKLVTWLALADARALRTGMSIRELATMCRWRVFKDPRLLNDLSDVTSHFEDVLKPTDAEWLSYWSSNPIAALTGPERPYFKEDGHVRPNFSIPDHLSDAFESLVTELAEYRLYRYVASQAARRPSIARRPITNDGVILDATFRLETALGEPLSVLFESSGGTKGKSGKNHDYKDGVDVVLGRLKDLRASIADAYVDSTKVQALPIAERRLLDGAGIDAIDLVDEDMKQLKARMLGRMAKVGQKEGAKGGNPRKSFRIVLAGLDHLDPVDVARFLETGQRIPVEADAGESVTS